MSEENSEQTLICVPGQVLCAISEFTVASEGTYEKLGYIHAALAGIVKLKKREKNTFISVISFGGGSTVPVIGDIVTTRITAVHHRMAKCRILCIGKTALNRPYRGIIRKEDVRATEIDRVELHKCFRPGDIVLARVLHQIELNVFHLSTADNELGVVVAISPSSRANSGAETVPMVPVCWTEVQCPVTLIKEPRKVAKVVPEKGEALSRNLELF
ncbi:exosomal 3'-5' exoribonuclease complex subunit ski4 [Anopheles darlingi]|uniref:Exosomal 3'-5' exoribonuclease complex subunit ski4 n=1 Tax=Anopheles darlingi TaxID=43151 RepID=W5J4Q9_ANODA|nr:exosome complex component CSL4 [Anopheles darlingi]ETN57850.1 exosomal 3'-5' exoribonuclease complex subunit ski4 [Anopheles darlingi]